MPEERAGGAPDVIELRGLQVVGICGALPEERERAQPLEIDLDVEADLAPAGWSDVLADTIDYGVLLAGELWLELDDGRQQLLKAGDSFVQNGTRHAWHNRGSEPAIMCAVMIGMAREA